MKYQLLEQQKQIMNNQISIQELDILQRNSVTRIKERVDHKRIYYHSSNEVQQNVRIFLFAFLLKIYGTYSPHNSQQLQKFKNLIYHTELNDSITFNQGIQASQLFKFFSQKINQLEIGDKTEEKICNLINNSSFFEDIVFAMIRQRMKLKKNEDFQEQIDSLIQFFEKQFNYKIKILNISQKGIQEEPQQIIFYKFRGHLYKKIVFGIQNRESSSSSLSKEKSIKRNSPLSLQKQQVSIKMESSIIKMEEVSPSNPNSSGNKKSNKKINPFELRQSSKIQKTQKKGIFDLFCCCN